MTDQLTHYQLPTYCSCGQFTCLPALSFHGFESQIFPSGIEQRHLQPHFPFLFLGEFAIEDELRAFLQDVAHVVLMVRQLHHEVLVGVELILDDDDVGADRLGGRKTLLSVEEPRQYA